MKRITDAEYAALLADRSKLAEARVHAMGQTAKIALLSASLAQADARNDALVAAMKVAARKLESWPKDPWESMRDVAAELRKAAA